MKSTIGIAVTVLVVLISGVIQGVGSNRWSKPESMLKLGAALTKLPEEAGPWKMTQAEEVGKNVQDLLECTGYVYRTYQNQETEEIIKVVVFIGPAGPISVHTPEVCYPSRSFRILEERHPLVVDNVGDNSNKQTVWKVTFQATDLNAVTRQVCYAWNDGSGWQADKTPRVKYASRPFLYKLQLDCQLPFGETDSDRSARFLRHFVPMLEKHQAEHFKLAQAAK